MTTEIRGVRLNNPTNIKREPANTWIGQSATQGDPVFVSFVDPRYCYRASTRIIMRNYAKGQTKIAQVVSHWAPPSENDTLNYTIRVGKRMSWDINHALTLPEQLPELLHAITMEEIGEFPYDDSIIIQGISLDKESAPVKHDKLSPITPPPPTEPTYVVPPPPPPPPLDPPPATPIDSSPTAKLPPLPSYGKALTTGVATSKTVWASIALGILSNVAPADRKSVV